MKLINAPWVQALSYTIIAVLILVFQYFIFGTLPQFLGYQVSDLYITTVYAFTSLGYIPLIYFLRRKWGIYLKQLFPTLKWKGILFIIPFSIALYIVGIAIIESLENYEAIRIGSINSIAIKSLDSSQIGIVRFVQSVILASILEEVFFRGLLFTFLLRYYSSSKSIVISSLLFMLAHFRFDDTLLLFFDGVVFAYIFYKTKSLTLSIIAHAITNFIGLIVSIEQIDIRLMGTLQAIVIVGSCAVLVWMIVLLSRRKTMIET